ncbi:unnamed protein product [Rhizopus stolonifer]
MGFISHSQDSYSEKGLGGRKQVEMFLNIYKLSQYYETFINEGFDRILRLLNITETDLITLNVKRGHRRVLQRAIATARGIPISTPIMINYGYHKTTHSHNECNIKAVYVYEEGLRYFYLKRKRILSKPIKPFDVFVNQLQTNSGLSTESMLIFANARWNQLTALEKETYERLALITNSESIV